MNDIQTRDDVYILVSTFYRHVRSNNILGPIFNRHIENDKWPAHINKLTDFWMTGLFGVICFKGNPTETHRHVDKNLNHTIDVKHFNSWLNLWFSTIDGLFEGPIANRAKEASRKMAEGQYKAIYKVRPKNNQEIN